MLDAFFNATLQRIDTPTGASAAGDPVLSTGAALAVRCVIDEPTFAQKFTLGDIAADVTAVLYTTPDALPAGAGAMPGSLLLVQTDDEPAGQLYQVIHRKHFVKDDLSHFELFLKAR